MEPEHQADLRRIRNLFLPIMCAGFLGLLLYATQYLWPWPRLERLVQVLGAAIVFAIAFLLAGALIGFLFGIPRTGQRSTDLKGSYIANPNLVQVSDWLTKMIVGIGLFELKSVPERSRALADRLSPALGNSSSFTMGLIVLFAACGFFLGYLLARSYLPEAFRRWEVDTMPPVQAAPGPPDWWWHGNSAVRPIVREDLKKT